MNSSTSALANNTSCKPTKATNSSENRPGNVMRLSSNQPLSNTATAATNSTINTHSRNSSVTDFVNANKSHSRTSSHEWSSGGYHYQSGYYSHSRNQSVEIKQMKNDLGKSF